MKSQLLNTIEKIKTKGEIGNDEHFHFLPESECFQNLYCKCVKMLRTAYLKGRK